MIKSDMHHAVDSAEVGKFMMNSKKLLSFILNGQAQPSPTPSPTPEPSLSSIHSSSSSSSSSLLILENYPFPITKGCYITIEQEYSSSFSPARQRAVQEAIDIITTTIASAQLKGTKSVAVSVIPQISLLFPDWEKYITPSFAEYIDTSLPARTKHQRTKFMKLLLRGLSVEPGTEICQALGISPAFYDILRGCKLLLAGKDDKGDRFCRNAMPSLTEEEKQDAIYELVSTTQAFVQESIQWTSQNKRTNIFEILPEHLVVWLNSHPSSGKVSSPSITTSISLLKRLKKYLPENTNDFSIVEELGIELNNCLKNMQSP